ncbi:uncharacterized protein CLUP02_02153 [Colletotrichum lupini]|uniref:Uncharacterized protein n=1 Tax=Colletotrichum lupini TaxID=145971 RepID=A0A9Q8SDQ9_9PEZI|nr:uncharacterized protein CLUP02_02153 [Colletotrichum lupini]UQC75499.1 hypothetical protein CLUP02_02153 [Colletotrichum lupini]
MFVWKLCRCSTPLLQQTPFLHVFHLLSQATQVLLILLGLRKKSTPPIAQSAEEHCLTHPHYFPKNHGVGCRSRLVRGIEWWVIPTDSWGFAALCGPFIYHVTPVRPGVAVIASAAQSESSPSTKTFGLARGSSHGLAFVCGVTSINEKTNRNLRCTERTCCTAVRAPRVPFIFERRDYSVCKVPNMGSEKFPPLRTHGIREKGAPKCRAPRSTPISKLGHATNAALRHRHGRAIRAWALAYSNSQRLRDPPRPVSDSTCDNAHQAPFIWPKLLLFPPVLQKRNLFLKDVCFESGWHGQPDASNGVSLDGLIMRTRRLMPLADISSPSQSVPIQGPAHEELEEAPYGGATAHREPHLERYPLSSHKDDEDELWFPIPDLFPYIPLAIKIGSRLCLPGHTAAAVRPSEWRIEANQNLQSLQSSWLT